MSRKPTITEKTKTADVSASRAKPDETTPETAALQPTSAADWPSKTAAKGIVIELPSGHVARLRKPPLQYLMATGHFPPKLWAKVKKEGLDPFKDPTKNLGTEDLRLLVDWMVSCSFVDPVVSMTRKVGTVFIGDLDELDKETVMEITGLSLAAGAEEGSDEQ